MIAIERCGTSHYIWWLSYDKLNARRIADKTLDQIAAAFELDDVQKIILHYGYSAVVKPMTQEAFDKAIDALEKQA
jgi:hypothetical protein